MVIIELIGYTAIGMGMGVVEAINKKIEFLIFVVCVIYIIVSFISGEASDITSSLDWWFLLYLIGFCVGNATGKYMYKKTFG